MSGVGITTAFVREVDTEGGRLLVEFRAMEDDLESSWAPIASPMAGPSRGQLFMPEVGDECLVAFQDRDFDHPFVVGFLWNGEQTSPETEATNRVIVTPGGHQLRFEDATADTRIRMESAGGHSLLLDDPATGPKVELASQGGRKLLLDDSPGGGKAELESTANKITLYDAPGSTRIEISAGMGVVTIALNATPQPSLSISVAGNSVDISAGAMNVTSAGPVNLTASAATISAGALTVSAGLTTFSGTVVASTLVAGTVVSGTYTPGAGNFL